MQRRFNQYRDRIKTLQDEQHCTEYVSDEMLTSKPKKDHHSRDHLCKLAFQINGRQQSFFIYENQSIDDIAFQLIERLQHTAGEDMGLGREQEFTLIVDQIRRRLQNIVEEYDQQNDKMWKIQMQRILNQSREDHPEKRVKVSASQSKLSYFGYCPQASYDPAIDQSRHYQKLKLIHKHLDNIKHGHTPKVEYGSHLYDKFVNSDAIKQVEIQRKSQEKYQHQMAQCTFHPKVNGFHHFLQQKKQENPYQFQSKKVKSVSVFDKLYKQAKEKELRTNQLLETIEQQRSEKLSEMTFVPKINKCSRQIVKLKKQLNSMALNQIDIQSNMNKPKPIFVNTQKLIIHPQQSLKTTFKPTKEKSNQKGRLLKNSNTQLCVKRKKCLNSPPRPNESKQNTKRCDNKKQNRLKQNTRRQQGNNRFIKDKNNNQQNYVPQNKIKRQKITIEQGIEEQTQQNEMDDIHDIPPPLQEMKIAQNGIRYFKIEPKHFQRIQNTFKSNISQNTSSIQQNTLSISNNTMSSNNSTSFFNLSQESSIKKGSRPDQFYRKRKQLIFELIFQYFGLTLQSGSTQKSGSTLQSGSAHKKSVSQFLRLKKNPKITLKQEVTAEMIEDSDLPQQIQQVFKPMTQEMRQLNVGLDKEEFIWSLNRIYDSLTAGEKGGLLGWGIKLMPQCALSNS